MEELSLPLECFTTPQKLPTQGDVLELKCESIETVRIAFIGVGRRMLDAIKCFMHIDGVEIKVLNDIVPENIEKAKAILSEKQYKEVATKSGKEDWKSICEQEDIDLIYVSTHYDLHTPIAVYAMQCGKHVALEVPAALTIEECWQLVDTAEQTQRHCFQLENCNYDPFELNLLNMTQKGLFGDLIHGEGAYIHDLKEQMFSEDKGQWNRWRLKNHEHMDGNLYPTHGLGPICHKMNIHRGDKLEYLVSMSTNQFGLSQYAKNAFGEASDVAQKAYKSGDMNTSLIRTHKGKTIVLQHDVTSPRPYSRIQLISGTKGFARKWPKREMSFAPNGLEPLVDKEIDALMKKHIHPMMEEVGEKHQQLMDQFPDLAKHDGIDYIMNYRLIYCLRHGLPLDMDVYDAAEWSAIIELSEKSVKNFSCPVQIPDFTRGAWQKLKQVNYYNK